MSRYYKDLRVFEDSRYTSALKRGERDTPNNASFFAKDRNTGRLKLYKKRNKTARRVPFKSTNDPLDAPLEAVQEEPSPGRSRSRSRSRNRTIKQNILEKESVDLNKLFKTPSQQKRSSVKPNYLSISADSSAHYRIKKKQGKRITKSIREGRRDRNLCGKSRSSNRCRFIKGNELAHPNCYLSQKSNRCVKKKKIDKSKCGESKKTKRCQFLRRNQQPSARCRVSKSRKRCVKV